MKKYFVLILFFVQYIFIAGSLYSQTFKNEIDAFAKLDSISMPAEGGIVFAGSSSFRIWKDVNAAFPNYPIINRGFGGSTLTDLIYYVEETIIKYKPKQILIYCGENDIAMNPGVNADTVLKRFAVLHSIIRKKLPTKTEIVFVSIKPSVSRWHLENTFVTANALIKKFLSADRNAKFLDVHGSMLNPDGSVMKDIFLSDNLHMNAKGYQLWIPIIRSVLMN
jgi:lysophospholipase L1-like esterase